MSARFVGDVWPLCRIIIININRNSSFFVRYNKTRMPFCETFPILCNSLGSMEIIMVNEIKVIKFYINCNSFSS